MKTKKEENKSKSFFLLEIDKRVCSTSRLQDFRKLLKFFDKIGSSWKYFKGFNLSENLISANEGD